MFVPPCNIDTLYDYIPLLDDEPLCKIPTSMMGTEIAIIGAGVAGLIAALELLKMGLKPIIYEANDRMGGRVYSQRFKQIQEEKQPFAEMGAMRIPLSSKIFFHYAKKMHLHYDKLCPSPGNVNTALYFKGKVYPWDMNSSPPDPFLTIQKLWRLFTEPLVDRIHKEWEIGNTEVVRQLWQLDIDQYKDMSLYQALLERSPLSSTEYIDIFGALGIGHGGFHPFFHISFLEILRILVNGYMSKSNVFVSEGLSEFIHRLYHLKVNTPYGIASLADNHCVRLNLPVVLFDYNEKTNNPIIIVKDKNNVRSAIEYRAVIFTGTLSALNMLNITSKTKSGVYLMNNALCNAIKNAQMTDSSKTYICTENKFWLEHNLPACIISDDITSSTYFFDYPSTKHGVILLSYAHAMDAMKLHAVDPKDRLTIFKRSLSDVYPELDKFLEPVNGEILNIDWVNEKYQNGAFKIFTPGNDERQKLLYLQFQSVLTNEDKGFYLAGDGISWSGGWIEGALYTSLNSVFAVAKRLGAKIKMNSPLYQNSNLYHY